MFENYYFLSFVDTHMKVRGGMIKLQSEGECIPLKHLYQILAVCITVGENCAFVA